MSMTKVKIWNVVTRGVPKALICYEKLVPSNMTVFELLNKLGKKFNCGWYEIVLSKINYELLEDSVNGCTLDELGMGRFV